jgi:hypothetical protein
MKGLSAFGELLFLGKRLQTFIIILALSNKKKN